MRTRHLAPLAIGISAIALAAPGPSAASPARRSAASGGAVSLDNGQISIPSSDVGRVDLKSLPLGDRQYSTAPERGKLDLCNPSMLWPPNLEILRSGAR